VQRIGAFTATGNWPPPAKEIQVAHDSDEERPHHPKWRRRGGRPAGRM